MGIIIGTFGLILGLFFLIFPNVAMNIFRIGPSGGGIAISKEKGKLKVGMNPTVKEALGNDKAKIFFRVDGIIVLILSIFGFISSNAP